MADYDNVKKTIDEKNFEPFIPDYINLSAYKKNGGYEIANKIRNGVISKKQVLDSLNESGLKGRVALDFLQEKNGKLFQITMVKNMLLLMVMKVNQEHLKIDHI